MMKIVAPLAFTFLAFIPMAQAQGLDPQAQILKTQIDAMITAQKSSAQKNGSTLVTKGDVTVEKAQGYYAYTLPHMTYTDAKGVRSEIGMIAINASPDGADNWRVSMAIPTPINSYDKDGKPLVRTDIGSQNASGVWNTKLGHFTNLNATLGNLRINDLATQNSITIGSATMTTALNEIDTGVWAGKADSTFNNIAVYSADTAATSNLPKITMTTNLTDRSGPSVLSARDIAERLNSGDVDGYNIFKMLIGDPERVQAVVTGLDNISTQLQQAMLTAPANKRQTFLTSILAVSAISGIGRPVDNDSSSKSYDVEFTQGGGMTINGTDFGSILTAKK
jgi:hypothetical protein